jgi:hypothetical protein
MSDDKHLDFLKYPELVANCCSANPEQLAIRFNQIKALNADVRYELRLMVVAIGSLMLERILDRTPEQATMAGVWWASELFGVQSMLGETGGGPYGSAN